MKSHTHCNTDGQVSTLHFSLLKTWQSALFITLTFLVLPIALPLLADNVKTKDNKTAAAKELKAAQKPKSEKWSFSLLPVGLQRNPQIEFTIMTEMTDEGRKLPEPSYSKPVFYISHSMGHTDAGGRYGGEKPIEYKYLEAQLSQALASNGYRPADEAHSATQVLFIAWGRHNRVVLPDVLVDGADDGYSGDGGDGNFYSIDSDDFKNLISRARLLGGKKFADEFADAVNQQLNWSGSITADAHGPLSDFSRRDILTETLVYQVFEDCYYLLVTSFDFEALKNNIKTILWTTKICTTSRGISFEGTLPNMIENGAYYFGRDMPMPDIIRKRAQKKATVDIGEATVEGYIMPSGTVQPATSGTATKKP